MFEGGVALRFHTSKESEEGKRLSPRCFEQGCKGNVLGPVLSSRDEGGEGGRCARKDAADRVGEFREGRMYV